jgi:hypothetical protein
MNDPLMDKVLTVGQAAAVKRALEEQEPGPPGIQLPSRQDQKVQAVVDRLKGLGAQVKVRRRKLAKGTKVYLVIKGKGGHIVFRDLVKPVIREKFPDVYTTSGSYYTRVERGKPVTSFDMTVALWK